MPDDDRPPATRTRDHLQNLGFTAYEAACLVTVLQRPGATAADIAEASSLPRSRVYDVADSLADRGLLEVAEGNPKRYRAIPRSEIEASLSAEYEQTLDALGNALAAVESADTADDRQSAVWSFTGRRSSLSHSWELIEEAEDEVWMLVRPALLSQDCVDEFAAAADRGVDLTFATDDDDMREWLGETLTTATFVDVPPTLANVDGDGRLARLIMTDSDAVLTVTRCQYTPADPTEYVGCMARGRGCGFVVACEALIDSFAPLNEA